MNRLSAGLRLFSRAIADFLFPPICFGCDQEIESGLVCDSCRLLLAISELGVCPECGWPTLPNQGPTGPCRKGLALSRVRALGLYQVPFMGLIHALKYSEKTALAGLLGKALSQLALQDSELARADAVCAVPLHRARERERGYNQSELLARVVALEMGRPLVNPIVRKKNTKSQTAIQDEERRRANLADAFAVRPGTRLDGARVLLIDDVTTTGATLDAASQKLLEAGASEVMGLVVAAATH